MRQILEDSKISEIARLQVEGYHRDVVGEVEKAISQNEWVIVGMAQNPFVKKARKLLEEKAIPFQYLEYGSYLGQWKQRLAIKLWSGWPTFPQVFHNGQLVGGADDLKKLLLGALQKS
jgi:glutaredoxin-related protein